MWKFAFPLPRILRNAGSKPILPGGSGTGNHGIFTGSFSSSELPGANTTSTVTIPNAAGKKVHFYLTFFGNYSGGISGYPYYPDDVDLQVSSGSDTWYSISATNTTEYIGVTQSSTARTYNVKVTLYNRGPHTDPGSPGYYSVAWAVQP